MKRILINMSLAALALTGCTQTELIDTNAGTKGMIDYALYAGRPTRAVELDNGNFTKFKIYAYQNIETVLDGGTFGFSAYYDETVEKGSGTWSGPRPRRWPEKANDYLNFYAYSDEVNVGSTYTAATAIDAHPDFTYTVPVAAAAQQDLLVSAAFNQTARTNQGKLNMDFKHALTQVAFKVKSASHSFDVKVSKVELIGANSVGKFTYDGTAIVGAWSDQKTPIDYAFAVATPAKVSNTDFVSLTATDGNLMMIPNTDPKDVKIRVTYTLNDDAEVLIKEVKLEKESDTAGANQPAITPVTAWAMGKRITYNLTLPGKANEIIFGDATIKEDWDATEDETNVDAKEIFGVTAIDVDGLKADNASFPLVINDNRQTAGAFTLTSDVAWVKFSETADGYKNATATLTVAAPTSRAKTEKKIYVYAANNTTGAERTATITMTRADYSTVSIEIKQKAPVANLFGANCYIITKAQAGNHALDATIKGNGKQVLLPQGYSAGGATDVPLTEDDLKIKDANAVKVLWETMNSTTTPSVGAIVKNVSYANGIVFFTTTGTPGNAVISVMKGSTVLWSWHIWCMDEEPKALELATITATVGAFDATASNTISGMMIMDRNLGALNATPQDNLSAGLFYQWGRSVPFPGSTSLQTSAAMAIVGTAQKDQSGSSTITMEQALANPEVFYYAQYAPWSVRNDNYWGTPKTGTLTINNGVDNYTTNSNMGSKTIYDPCPKDWRVAPGYTFANLSKTTAGNFDKGYSANILNTGSLWIPSPGRLSNGNLESIGKIIQTATSTVGSDYRYSTSLFVMNSSSSLISPIFASTDRAAGASIRCIKE